MISRTVVNRDSDTEKIILTGLITSKRFCTEIRHLWRDEYFESDFTRRLGKWAIDYYDKYKDAAGKNIKNIFKKHRKTLKDADSELIENFLIDLSEKFVENRENQNDEFIIDEAIHYFKKREISIISENAQILIDEGKVDEAESQIQRYKTKAKDLSQSVDPFDEDYCKHVFENSMLPDEEKDGFLFRFPGALGEMMGGMFRKRLVAFLGPMKRGKSFMLQEAAFHSITNNLNTLHITCEMSAEEVSERFYNRIFANVDSPTTKSYLYPVFDCFHNQNNTCKKKERIGSRKLLDNNNNKPVFGKAPKLYKPCAVCRGKEDFNAATWFEPIKKRRRIAKSLKNIKAFNKQYKNRYKIKFFPADSASVDTIKQHLEMLEYTEGWIVDTIVIDYADLLTSNIPLIGRDKIDNIWKGMKNLSQTKHCGVVSASQSTRATLDKKNVKASDMAEDIRKVAHVDSLFGLNQTEKEKAMGIMRISNAAHRHKGGSSDQVMILQHLKSGQSLLDSEFLDFDYES